MTFFKKGLASLGIGNTKVDTKLEKTSFQPGETVTGVVEIKGGAVEQDIDSIYLHLYANYTRESNDKKYEDHALIEKVKLTEPFSIQPDEEKQLPFSFVIPLETPITAGKTKVWIKTGLDIKNAVDPSDEDHIRVEPTALMKRVIESVEALGFTIRKVDCEEAPHRLRGKTPFVQEVEFVPATGEYRGKLDELEVIFFPESATSYELIVEVDRKAKGLGGLFSEAMGMDESMVRLRVREEDLSSFTHRLRETINQFS